MKNIRSFILGAALIVLAIVIELEWIRTGDIAMGIYTLLTALSAAALIGHSIRTSFESADNRQSSIAAA